MVRPNIAKQTVDSTHLERILLTLRRQEKNVRIGSGDRSPSASIRHRDRRSSSAHKLPQSDSVDEFSVRKSKLAAGLNMENDSEASKPGAQVPTTRLSSAYPSLSRDSCPPSSYSKVNSTGTSPQYQNLSRASTASQIMDEDSILARYATLPLPSSSQTYPATPEPRDVPLPTEDLSDDEQNERDDVVSPTHQNLIE